ncbi:MAG: 50S ribosomal protein L21 [Candidatus Omnitrophica bacterium]|nr:50S ribosomal protein L21 [Candidatus Omnitrophota bacterium]
MWAIVEIAKKQYIVSEGETIAVERLKGEGPFVFEDVLLCGAEGTVQIGKPYLKNVKIKADLVEEKKAKKVVVYKFKRRKKYRKTRGHRQIHTYLKISKITVKK